MTREHLIFNTQLIEIKQMLTKVENIGVDVTALQERVKIIEQQVNQQIKERHKQYESQEELNNMLKEGFFANIYQKGIEQLKVIQNYLLEEFDVYSKIHGKYQYIKSGIENITKDNINTFIEETKSLLKQINDSPNIDYNMYKKLIENVYQLAYQIIKKEFQINESSILLQNLTDIDITYIELYLLEEIEKLSLKKSSNISRKIKELETNGLDVNYLQEDLLKMLWTSEKKLQSTNSTKESTKPNSKKQLIDREEALTATQTKLKLKPSLKNKIEKQEKKVEAINKKIRKKEYNILRKRFFLVGYASTIIAISAGGTIALNNLSKQKHYYTKEETYQSGVDIPDKFYYEHSEEDKVLIIKYYPYEKLKFWNSVPEGEDRDSNFFCKIETYDVSEIELENLEDYLELDLESLGVESKDTKDYKVYLTPDDTYQEPYVLVKRISHDLDKYNETSNKGLVGPLSVGLNFILTMLSLFDKKRKNAKKAIIENKETKKELIEELEKEKEKLIELEEKLIELESSQKKLTLSKRKK